jgi:hypothetical protein
MTKSLVCFPSENESTLDCFFSNFPAFDIKISLEFDFQPNQETLAFKKCTILYRRSHILKGCKNLLSQDPCNCKLIADFLLENGVDTDLKSDIVINNCVNRTFGKSKDPYSKLVDFSFDYNAADTKIGVMLDHSDFGAFLCGVSHKSDISHQMDDEQRGIMAHISQSIPTGSVVYFIIDRDHLFKSRVPSVRESRTKLDLKIKPNIYRFH